MREISSDSIFLISIFTISSLCTERQYIKAFHVVKEIAGSLLEKAITGLATYGGDARDAASLLFKSAGHVGAELTDSASADRTSVRLASFSGNITRWLNAIVDRYRTDEGLNGSSRLAPAFVHVATLVISLTLPGLEDRTRAQWAGR